MLKADDGHKCYSHSQAAKLLFGILSLYSCLFVFGNPLIAEDVASAPLHSGKAVFSDTEPHSTYVSTFAHGYVPMKDLPTWLPEYLSRPIITDKSNREYSFNCPGDSVLTRILTRYESESSQIAYRNLSFTCDFLKDSAGDLLQKNSCHQLTTKIAVASKLGDESTLNCPSNEVVSGLDTTWSDSVRDQAFKMRCCKLSVHGKEVLVEGKDEIKDSALELTKPSYELACPKDLVVSKIMANFWTINNSVLSDREFRLYCSRVSVP